MVPSQLPSAAGAVSRSALSRNGESRPGRGATARPRDIDSRRRRDVFSRIDGIARTLRVPPTSATPLDPRDPGNDLDFPGASSTPPRMVLTRLRRRDLFCHVLTFASLIASSPPRIGENRAPQSTRKTCASRDSAGPIPVDGGVDGSTICRISALTVGNSPLRAIRGGPGTSH